MPVSVLTYKDRIRLAAALAKRYRIADIAKALSVSPSTIYSEIVRGGGAYNKVTSRYEGYSPDVANAVVQGGRYRKYRRLG